MAADKPSIPKGTRDFSPLEMARRDFIFQTVKDTFRLYGYSPIETPAMENLSTLLGKYGEEGDKLLFRILNSGNYLNGINPLDQEASDIGKFTSQISEKGLRYDLTVPFARYVVQHLNDISFPFKRYQIQPVWRADKPQKGRYREFYQCDVDVIGSDSLLNETELVQIIQSVFDKIGIRTVTKLNNRKILIGIAGSVGAPERFTELTVAMDKLDKTSKDKVFEELREKGFSEASLEKLEPFLFLKGTSAEKLEHLKTALSQSETGLKGIAEMEFIFDRLQHLGLVDKCELDLSLARGLNYYTGAIIEVKALDAEIGSICGGGRYDDLTGIFGLKGVSGVGISFGADRIYDVLQMLDSFPATAAASTRVLFLNFGEKEEKYCLLLADNLRKLGINTEVYPEASKLKKQMKYADQKNIAFVALVGEEEISSGRLTVKNMQTGEQLSFSPDEFTAFLLKN